MAAASLVRDRERELKTLRAGRLEAREVAAAANEAWLDARQRYLAGLAAELATTLDAGSPCPVCGSVKHPNPAAPTLEHVTPDEEDALMGVARAARETVERIDAELLRVEQARADALAGSGGLSRKAARKRHDDALAAAEAADRAVVEHEELSARLSDLIAATEDRRERRESCARDLSAVRERTATARRRLDECREQRAQAVGPDGDLGKRRDCLAAQGKACRRLLEAAHAEAAAVEASAFADHRLADAVTASEFADIDDVLEAALPPSEIANAEALARSYAADLAAAQRSIDDPNLVDAAAQAAPDLEALEASADDAAATAGAARSTYDAMARAVTRLESLSDDITAELATLNPLRAAYDLADDVAGICTGTSPDNPTRTALSHYVLGARLAQVVEAANSRLQSIAGGRYRLLHTTAREAGDTRGGLGLLVSDLHTDQLRDPVTLSGGETFYVSLSLALGLADVVAHEAGGAELATLFVDEGFGSLDDATRDEVLDELDALRAGGRTVGLVSHLAELRSRFPTQIRINATRNGSQCLSTSTWTSDRAAEWTGDER
jgi:exonuclease SbcC